jgi:serine O-acetyltransferase
MTMINYKKIPWFILLFVRSLRLIPHWIIFNFHKNKSVIHQDIERWMTERGNMKNQDKQIGFLYFMNCYPEYRNLFYFRIGMLHRFICFLCPSMNTLFITPVLGNVQGGGGGG